MITAARATAAAVIAAAIVIAPGCALGRESTAEQLARLAEKLDALSHQIGEMRRDRDSVDERINALYRGNYIPTQAEWLAVLRRQDLDDLKREVIIPMQSQVKGNSTFIQVAVGAAAMLQIVVGILLAMIFRRVSHTDRTVTARAGNGPDGDDGDA